MSRIPKMMIWSAIGVVAILALCVAVLLTFDWNRIKPWLNARVSEATGRPFAINGDLSMTWQRARSGESGWRGIVPWPLLNAQNITLGNPDWANAAPNMAQVGHVIFSLNPLSLLNKKIVIPTLVLGEPDLTLQRAADGKNNWTLRSSTPSAWKLELGQLELNEGKVRLVDAIRHVDVNADIDTLDQNDASDFRIGWKLTGTVNGLAVRGNGKAGAILALQQEKKPYPIDASLHIGKTSIDAKGTLTKPISLTALDMRLKLSGASMAQLYPITGILLPETPPYATEGHLTGILDKQGGDWKYERFTGKVGASDIAGTFSYESGKPRPLLTGVLVSNLLKLEDLGPLIGLDSNASKIKSTDKAFPARAFHTERWASIDANVKFTGRKILREKELPIENLVTELHMKDGVLSLTPLNFGVAGGNLISTVKLDGREKTIKAEMKMSARHLKLKELFPTFQVMQASFGEINGDVLLSGTGNTVAALLGSSNGEVKGLIDQGTISKLLLEQIGLNVGSIILTQLFGDRQVNINCMATDFSVTNGLMQARTFVIDTDEAVLLIKGQINLKNEQLDLTINPESRGARLVSLRAPLYVTGSFKKPEVNVDKGVLATKAGGAIALGVLAPIATAILPLVNMGGAKDSGCNKLLEEARTKPVAPPPGKPYRGKRMQKEVSK